MALSKIRNDSLEDTAVHGRRNLLLNGSLKVAQRGASHTGLSSAGYRLDRWETHLYSVGDSRFTVEQTTNQGPDGFHQTHKISCTTADSTQDASNQVQIEQQIEQQDINRLKYYESSPDKVTLSFWCKSNTTGTYGINFKLSHNNSSHAATTTRIYPTTFSISSADTWEYKTITVTLDSASKTRSTTLNGYGMSIMFWLGAGSNRDGNTADAWRDNNNQTTTTVTAKDIGGSTSNYFEFTGCQLEVGEQATPFEHRSFGEELALCQRYYTKSWSQGSAVTTNPGVITASCVGNANRAFGSVFWPTTMRTGPTVTWYSGSNGTVNKWRNGSQGTNINPPSAIAAIGESGYGFVLSSGISSITDTLQGHYEAEAEL